MSSHLSTSQSDALAALCKAWLAGDASAGPPLHDALEEAGWPGSWIDYGWERWALHVGGYRLAGAEPAAGWPHRGGWYWEARGEGGSEGGFATTLHGAQTAALAALRRALAGG